MHPESPPNRDRLLLAPISKSLVPLMVCLVAVTTLSWAGVLPELEADQGSDPEQRIAPWLRTELETGGDPKEMLILLDGSAPLAGAEGLATRADKGRHVYEVLRSRALATQGPLVAWMQSQGVEILQRFWIVNAILVRGDLPLAERVARRQGVRRIVGNPLVKGLPQAVPVADPFSASSLGLPPLPLFPATQRQVPSGVTTGCTASFPMSAADTANADESQGEFGPSSGLTPQAVEWGVGLINADDVWTLRGVRGEGIVVATMDTGVEWNHPALLGKYRGWNGSIADHSYSWHDPVAHTTVPLDDHGHGTHVTGTMVGDDGAGNQVGVAPGARWIGCRNMNQGNGTPALYLECIQWGLAPWREGTDPFVDGRPDLGADITNNSWTCPASEGCDWWTLEKAFEHVRAAGQMTVAAAGNAGSLCSTVKEPPAIYDAVLSVGAVSSARELASFSGRGPVTIDGSNRLKPNVAAPGVSIRSSVRGGGYGTSSGTSMASPHTSGAMALLWSAKPQLRHLIRISRCYLEQAAGAGNGTPASCGGTGPADRPNNLWGWGVINVLGAIDLGPDGDGDGIAGACDCAAANAGAFEVPPHVTGEGFPTGETIYEWASLAPLAGTGTTYDVVRGLVTDLRVQNGFATAVCRADNQVPIIHNDIQRPPAGNGFYYVVRGQNACGSGSYGDSSSGAARTVTACP